ncbi:hypothetical protein O181_130195 [Austropuccinia psidii MF-1]|uniref:Uncharacterized protein n=1 Tax=Austropuccinia psidii MF-1 TaxID=1389203 RepID=A0A9Q3QAQ8_9BASI|nr:hypothetical protein [Austropuccinia psidii MF-1]
MSFNRFPNFDHTNPDDPLSEPNLRYAVDQQNQRILFLEQQLQQSQKDYKTIVEKVNTLQLQKGPKEKNKKNQLSHIQISTNHNNSKILKTKNAKFQHKDNHSHKSNPYHLVMRNTPPDFQYTKVIFITFTIKMKAVCMPD